MDKMIDVPAFTHVIKLNDRKNIIISGIKKINNFDDKEFNLESIMGNIIIKGESLEMIKLDTLEGNVSIKGKINSFTYNDTGLKENAFIFKYISKSLLLTTIITTILTVSYIALMYLLNQGIINYILKICIILGFIISLKVSKIKKKV